MDAEHLMALKHGKRAGGGFSETPMAPIITARKIKEESSDEEEIGHVPHNRGNKLKRKANPITGGTRLIVPELTKANSSGLEDNEEEIRANFKRSLAVSSSGRGSSSKREVIQIHRTHRGSISVPGVDGATVLDGLLEDSDEDPYAEVKINEILSPLESSTEILKRPQLRKLFQSPQLQIMAVHAMAMIEREKMVNKMMSRVALILQGDDPLYPQLGYGLGEGCSSGYMGMPDEQEYINGNEEWKKKGEDQEQVQKTLSLLMDNINCSNQYIDLLSQSRDGVNHVLKEKKRLWKKLKEKREKELRRRFLSKGNKGGAGSNNQASTSRDKHS
ncbi:hypothetical protein BG006_001750 [Podila minutissima]|uniref:Transcriptional regulatory protein RXT2 N-terminal domain-containing protein n=1 Tax=Podila minutissima TaxID=64525 RepID=A0A9P5SPC6_9FUNG|nr:hypothetical protein BG006_001750 [Podila minutissima]